MFHLAPDDRGLASCLALVFHLTCNATNMQREGGGEREGEREGGQGGSFTGFVRVEKYK